MREIIILFGASPQLFFFCAGMGLVDARMRPDRTEGGGLRNVCRSYVCIVEGW